MAKTYWEKLKDPRWQRKRLEVMGRAGFACENCEATEVTLHVHHRIYRKGADPWEYTNDDLACLCETCHEEETRARAHLDEAIARASAVVCLDVITGYIDGLWMRSIYDESDIAKRLPVISGDYMIGLAAACDISEVNLPTDCVHARLIYRLMREEQERIIAAHKAAPT